MADSVTEVVGQVEQERRKNDAYLMRWGTGNDVWRDWNLNAMEE